MGGGETVATNDDLMRISAARRPPVSRTVPHYCVAVDLDDEALELLHMPARQPPTLHKLIDRAGAALDAHVAHLGPRLSDTMGEVAAASSIPRNGSSSSSVAGA